MAHHTFTARKRANGTFSPVRFTTMPAKGDTVALYGHTGTVVTASAVRKGHAAVAVAVTCNATGKAATLYGVPPVQEVAYGAVQPVPHGHYYGYHGQYAQSNL